MKVLLISPPFASCYAPLLGMICIKSFLQNNGVECTQVDASIDALHYLLSPKVISNHLIESISFLNSQASSEFKKILKNNCIICKLDEINSEDILSFLSGVWFPDRLDLAKENYKEQLDSINQTLMIAYAHCYPALITLSQYYGKYSRIQDPEHAPFLEYYQEQLFPQIEKEKPDVLALSFAFNTQILPGLALMQQLRSRFSIPIVTGGSLLTYLYLEITPQCDRRLSMSEMGEPLKPKYTLLYNLVGDYSVFGEGEGTFEELLQALGNSEKCRRIPGVVWKDPSDIGVHASLSDTIAQERLPALDLAGLPIGKKYLTPLAVAPLLSSRGCYWRKCTFCNHSLTIGSQYRQIPVSTVEETLDRYEKANIALAVFCDDAMSPVTLRRVSRSIKEKKQFIRFATMIRFEKGLLDVIPEAAEGGLSFLSFGLESGSPRIVELMNKGYTHDIAVDILKACRRNRVLVHLFVMFGFPTETKDDVMKTFQFLEDHTECIHALSSSSWYLEPGCAIFHQMDRFGLEPVSNQLAIGRMGIYGYRKFKRREGISYEEANAYGEHLRLYSPLRDKVTDQLRHQEYVMIAGLCSDAVQSSSASSPI